MPDDAESAQRPIYVIDTSALVDLRRDYPLATFGQLWQRLADLAGGGRLIAPEEVRHELSDRDDELKRWAASVDGLFCAPDAEFVACWARVVRACDYLVPLTRRHAADSWVVGLALQRHEAEQAKLFPIPIHVVSHEVRPTKPGAQGKIPNACDRFRLSHIRLTRVFALEGWTGL